MTDKNESGPVVGSAGWMDLTVADAPGVRDFYKSVVGFGSDGVDMGGYEDFNMLDAKGTPVGGVCHARGTNADIPPVWMIYFIVADLDASLAACEAGGGATVVGPKSMGTARYAIVRDPAGAHAGLYQAG